MATATFAAGCFWGVEETFRRVEGVRATEVGYTGGHTENPTYKQVCAGDTGHAEAVRVTYDPARVSYTQLLEVLFQAHDPTQRNRQGPDVGSQYRSAIFYHDDQQRAAAERMIDQLQSSEQFTRPIVTEVVPAATFHPAEDYHQQYLAKRGQGACATTIGSE
jgi:peptide-methionine (S)-S-oxide reductase